MCYQGISKVRVINSDAALRKLIGLRHFEAVARVFFTKQHDIDRERCSRTKVYKVSIYYFSNLSPLLLKDIIKKWDIRRMKVNEEYIMQMLIERLFFMLLAIGHRA